MPASFLVFCGLVVCVIVAPIGVKLASYVLGRRRHLCPGCNTKALAMTGGALTTNLLEAEPRYPASWTEYECERCSAKFVRPLGKELVTRQAWIAGAQEPIPTATVVTRDRRDGRGD